MDKTEILIIEDNAAFLEECSHWLKRPEHVISSARNVEEGYLLMKKIRPNLVILDLRLPPSNDPEEGLRLLRESIKQDPLTKVIILTIEDKKEVALDAIKNGAEDFLIKPVDPDVLTIVVDRALKKQALETEVRRLRDQVNSSEQSHGIIGKTRVMRNLVDLVSKISTSNANVLIQGESGTGKEIIARAIHDMSHRKDQRLVTVNCAAITESIEESELFGHEQWAFTDAKKTHIGAFELADRGTIFLDEIESMPPKTQAKLLRVIEEKKIRRVGGRDPRDVDFRILSATNMDLKTLVAEGVFREDLYYRLNTITLKAPPLRERLADIEPLANRFLHTFCQEEDKKIFGFDDEVIRILEQHHWPGNVRELKNEIHWLVIQAEDNQMIYRDNISPEICGQEEKKTLEGQKRFQLKESLEKFEREILTRAIAHNGGNVTRAAADLGITRQNLYFKMNKYNIT